MDFDVLKAIVNDGGGWDKVIGLIFDNSQIYVNAGAVGGDSPITESDFKEFGGTYCFKQAVTVRGTKRMEYDTVIYNYHPLDHLQSVVMGDSDSVDIMSVNDMAGR